MQIHNLPAQTTAADAYVLAIDNGTATQKITTANLKKKMIGTTDISSLSTDGTVTGALAKLNTDINTPTLIDTIAVSTGTLLVNNSYRIGKLAFIHIRMTGVTINAWESLVTGLPLMKRVSDNYYIFGQIITNGADITPLGFSVYADNALHPWKTLSDATIDLMYSYVIG